MEEGQWEHMEMGYREQMEEGQWEHCIPILFYTFMDCSFTGLSFDKVVC